MPVLSLSLYLARIKVGQVARAWTTIRAKDEQDAKDLLEVMYGEGNIASIVEVANSTAEYNRRRDGTAMQI